MRSSGEIEAAFLPIDSDAERYLFLTLGAPGSGKSMLAELLEEKLGAVILNSDKTRAQIFDNDDKKIQASYTPEGNAKVFEAIDKEVEQKLPEKSIILDANNNRYEQRQQKARLAQAAGAKAVVLCVQTPLEEAIDRARDRPREGHQVPVSEENVRRMAARIELPRKDERMVVIDGMAGPEEQWMAFKQQMEEPRYGEAEV